MTSDYDDVSEAIAQEKVTTLDGEEKIPTLDSADEEVPDECDESVDDETSENIQRDSYIADTAYARRSSTMKEARQRASFHL